MRVLSKAVCATLFILSALSSLCAQISLDKIVYQTSSNQYGQLHFEYENELVSEIQVNANVYVAGEFMSDTTQLIVKYNEGQFDNIISSSSKVNKNNFGLNFRYHEGKIDTIFFTDANWIGMFLFEYDLNQNLIFIDKYRNNSGELEKSHSLEFVHQNNTIIKKKYYEFFSNNEGDWDVNTDKFQYENDALKEIEHNFSSSNGYGKTRFVNQDNQVLSTLKENYNGGDEIVHSNEYFPGYYEHYSYSEINHPLELFDLLKTLDLFSYRFVIDREDQFYKDQLLVNIKKNGDIIEEFIYSDADIVSAREELSEPTSSFIYPNPVRDYLYFSNGFEAEYVSVFDLNGELECKMNYLNSNVNLSNLASGQYILHALSTSGQKMVIQFMKE